MSYAQLIHQPCSPSVPESLLVSLESVTCMEDVNHAKMILSKIVELVLKDLVKNFPVMECHMCTIFHIISKAYTPCAFLII